MAWKTEDCLFALRNKVRVGGSNEAQLRAWNVHASAIASVPVAEIEHFSNALTVILESIIPLKYAPDHDSVMTDVASLRQFAATADPVALQEFDISWSSHAGFPCSRGVTKLLECAGQPLRLAWYFLVSDEASCNVWRGSPLLFRTSMSQSHFISGAFLEKPEKKKYNG